MTMDNVGSLPVLRGIGGAPLGNRIESKADLSQGPVSPFL